MSTCLLRFAPGSSPVNLCWIQRGLTSPLLCAYHTMYIWVELRSLLRGSSSLHLYAREPRYQVPFNSHLVASTLVLLLHKVRLNLITLWQAFKHPSFPLDLHSAQIRPSLATLQETSPPSISPCTLILFFLQCSHHLTYHIFAYI